MASTGGQPVKRSFTTTNYIVGTSIYWSKPISLILHQIPRDNVPQNMPKRRTPTILVSVHYMYVCMYVCVTVFTRAGLIICTYRISALVCRTISPSCLCELCCPIICPIGSRSLRSSDQGLLRLPFTRTSIRQNRAFSVMGPSIASILGPYLSPSLV